MFKEIEKELAKIEVSFSRRKTLKGGDVKVVNNGLSFILFFFSLFKHR